ncbi:MAG: galactokinase, partial [Bacteroidota bacterium]
MIQDNSKVISYKIEEHFSKKYGREAEVAIQSPGRINVIGEHTDYNLGYVLPAAIDHYMFVAVSKNGNDKINLYSVDYDEEKQINLKDEIVRGDSGWLNLIAGVVKQLQKQISGFDLVFGGNIPEGAGVSSSAALCCGVAMAVSELFDLKLQKWDIAKIAQKSEHTFALVHCGIMDQFACLFGLTNHVLLLNCRDFTYEESEVAITGFRFLLINSNVKHTLGDSDYNTRKDESGEALRLLKTWNPEVGTYQDVTRQMIDECQPKMDAELWKRAFHIVTENQRVFLMKDALKKKDQDKVGSLLTEGHTSLKENYKVTCEETDFLVDELVSKERVLGARQVGGGFGGCVLALVKDADISQTLAAVEKSYRKKFGLSIDNIPVKIS